ncbi:hypothetical protein KSP40_PGU005408 [Platanthera guangdongensis]|uniref:Uncharacterized protein n=1 Tax=Platanthera guangdongensis TaxID=2320717 RepID=A0ABR2N5T9_9ASPA
MDRLKAMVVRSLVKGLPKFSSFSGCYVCAGCQYGMTHPELLPINRSILTCFLLTRASFIILSMDT